MTALLPPWAQPGFHSRASAWIEEQFKSTGRTVLAPPELVRTWPLSRVLLVRTSTGAVYFKATANQPLFANEGTLIGYLASLKPDQVPHVIAMKADANWMLLEDAGVALPDRISPELKVRILAEFAAVQRSTIGHEDRLLAAGCTDRRPEHLPDWIEPLLHDPLAMSGLGLVEADALRGRATEIVEMCARVADFGIPSMLIHGDLHARNVLVRDDAFVFIDWTEACVAHPFMDAFMIYNEEDAQVRNWMRDAFLPAWTDFEPMDRLRELWSLCGVTHAMHHAVSYWAILRNADDDTRAELTRALPFLLRKALRYLNETA